MHARVTTSTIQLDKIDEGLRIFRDSIVPEAQKQNGFSDILMLIDRATGKCTVYALWASEADLRATEASGHYQSQVARLASLMVGQPTREICEVTVNELSTVKTGTLRGRVSTAMFQQGKIDEGIRIVRDSIVPEAKKQQGFDGLLSVLDRGMGKGILLTLWESEADVSASESSGYYQAQVAKLGSLLMAQPTREEYEVIVPVVMAPAGVAAVDTQVHPPMP